MDMSYKLLGVQAQADKRTVTAIRCVAPDIARNPRKSVQKLAAVYKTEVNSMKHIVSEVNL
jgi:hypothetical protein